MVSRSHLPIPTIIIWKTESDFLFSFYQAVTARIGLTKVVSATQELAHQIS